MSPIDAANAPAADWSQGEQDLGPLAWVLDELRKSLDGAVKAMRRFVRDAEAARESDLASLDAGALRIARQQLHQASGALEMVGMGPPALVLRSMEAAVQKFVQRPELCSNDAAAVIERASFALVEYLESVLAGKQVSPVALFPQYRDAQALTGAERVHPADLWPVERRFREPDFVVDAAPLEYGAEARSRLDAAVLRIVRSGDLAAAREMQDICLGFVAGQSDRQARAFWKICAGFFEALAQGRLAPDVYVKRVASRVLMQYATLARGEPTVADRLVQDLLFFCSQARPASDDAAAPPADQSVLHAVRQAFGLERFRPVDYSTPRFGLYDPALLAQARKRIAAATETWSALAGGDRNKLKPAADQFSLVCDSLAKLQPGSEPLSRALSRAVDSTVRSGEPPLPALAMEVATAVLYLQASFEELETAQDHMADRASRLAERLDSVAAGGESAPLEPWMEELYRRVSDHQTMGSVVDELRATLGEVEKSLDQYFRSPGDLPVLGSVPGRLAQMRGVLSVLGLDQASLAVVHMRDTVERLLRGDVPEEERQAVFEKLGSNLGALGFLIDMLSYQRTMARKLFIYDEPAGELRILMGRTRTRAGDLPEEQDAHIEARAPVPAPLPLVPDGVQPPIGDGPAAPEASRVAPVAAPVPAAVAPAAPMASEEEADDEGELLDIFLEEAREVVANGLEAVEGLRSEPADLSGQTTLRRAFHTLKGSSRMVGLNDFGEAAWSMEQVLNAWLAEQKPIQPPMLQLSDEALRAFGRWADDIAAGRTGGWGAPGLRGVRAGHARAGRIPAAGRRCRGGGRRGDGGPVHRCAGGRSAACRQPRGGRRWPRSTSGIRRAGSPTRWTPTCPWTSGAGRGSPVAEPETPRSPPKRPPAFDLDLDLDFPSEAAAPDEAPLDFAETLPPVPDASTEALPEEAPAEVPSAELAEDIDFSAFSEALAEGAASQPAEAALPAAHDDAPLPEIPDASSPDAALQAAGMPPWPICWRRRSCFPMRPCRWRPRHRWRNRRPMPGPTCRWTVNSLPRRRTPACMQVPMRAWPQCRRMPMPMDRRWTSPVRMRSPWRHWPRFRTMRWKPRCPLPRACRWSRRPPPRIPSRCRNTSPERKAMSLPGRTNPRRRPERTHCWGPSRRKRPSRSSRPCASAFPSTTSISTRADEWSRRLVTCLQEWSLELHEPLPDTAVALAHSLAGSSATVGFQALSDMARALEHALQHVQLQPQGTPEQARVFMAASEDIRRLLHQFAAGFLKEPHPQILAELREILESEIEPAPWEVPAGEAADAQPHGHAGADAEAPADPGPDAGRAVSVPATEEPARAAMWRPRCLCPARAGRGPGSRPRAGNRGHGHRRRHRRAGRDRSRPVPDLRGRGGGIAARAGRRTAPVVGPPREPGCPQRALRALHTLKGSSRLAGAMRLGEMAHRLESAVEQIDSEAPSAEAIEPLLVSFDGLQASFDALRSIGAQGLAQAVAVEPLAAQGPAAESTAGTVAEPAPAPVPRRAVALPGASQLTAARPVSSQSVRVRAQLLDRLVNQAGEVMIARSRLDARMAQMKDSLADLTGNLERLRQQLRDIEVQAETQMQSRLALSKDSSADFDPLEFDRFTRVQELTRMMAESVNDVATVQRNLQRTMEGAEDDLIAQGRQARELQRDLLRTRMVEFEGISERLYAVVRQASKETGKQIKLDIAGGSIEMDRGVLDRMTPAFEHLLRNCVAHGIEPPEARTAAGKPATGSITVALKQDGNDVSVEFRDDGAGLDLERIRAKAASQGLIAPDAVVGPAEAAQLIFMPGFSTAAEVTGLSGRGIGMDVVRSEVNALGGRVETTTEAGQGTSFRMVLPLTTAVTQVVMLRAGALTLGVPANLVEIVRRTGAGELDEAYRTGSFEDGVEALPFFWAGALLQSSASSQETSGRTRPVVILRSASQRIAMHVDEVLGNQEVVVKNLGPQLSRLPGLAGMSVLASGAVVLIYNPVALATVYGEQVRTQMTAPVAASVEAGSVPSVAAGAAGGGGAPIAPASQVPLVLVVDDSITVRRVTQRLLKREGYRVALAADGLQALERLQEERPAVVLSDIEMPRMDGFDLARNIRADRELHALPIIMITSRIAQKHREHAAELGVNHYLGKPYSDEELLSLVHHYARAAAAAAAGQGGGEAVPAEAAAG